MFAIWQFHSKTLRFQILSSLAYISASFTRSLHLFHAPACIRFISQLALACYTSLAFRPVVRVACIQAAHSITVPAYFACQVGYHICLDTQEATAEAETAQTAELPFCAPVKQNELVCYFISERMCSEQS